MEGAKGTHPKEEGVGWVGGLLGGTLDEWCGG